MKKNILLRASIQSMLALCLSLGLMMTTIQETSIAFADGVTGVATFIVHTLNQGSPQYVKITPPNICICTVSRKFRTILSWYTQRDTGKNLI